MPLCVLLCSALGPTPKGVSVHQRRHWRLVGRRKGRTAYIQDRLPWVSTPPLWTHQIYGSPASKIRKATSKYGELALAVRRARPADQDVRPAEQDALAISRRIGVVRCPLAGRKGNGVSYTLLQTRKSQKQRLQHNSASRAPLSLPRMGRSAPWCGAPGHATSAVPMVDGNGRSFG